VLAEGDATAVRNAIVERIEGYVGPAVQSKSSHTVTASVETVAAVSSYTDLQQALDDNSDGVTVVAYSALWCRKCRSVCTCVCKCTICLQ
jgi:thiol:disulfide interchange protein